MTTNYFGLGVALITPFRENGDVDFAALKTHVNRMIDNDVDYLVALGTTSEYVTLSDSERQQVVNTIIETNNRRKPIILGIGGNNTRSVVEKLGKVPDDIFGILSVTPYYNKPSQAGLFAHFKAIASATDKPIILYNVPGRTSVNLSVQTTIELAIQFSNIIGIKEASGNMVQIMEIISQKPDKFQVISGDDALSLPLIAAGATGLISVAGNAFPKIVSKMIQLSLNNCFGEARATHNKLLPLVSALFEDGNPSGIKAAMSILGYCTNTVRQPLVPVQPKTFDKIKNSLILTD